jgi:hypothetical protein
MAAHESVQMSIEQDTLERFRQGVREVDRGINPLELDEVVCNPLLDCKMRDIHVTGALRWLALAMLRAAALSS